MKETERRQENSSAGLTFFSLISFLHCRKYQYAVFLLPVFLKACPGSSPPSFSSAASSRCRRSRKSGLLFLNDLLEAMLSDREPNLSRPGEIVWESGGSASPLEDADRDRNLALGSLENCHVADVRTLRDRCRDTSRRGVRVDVCVEKTDNPPTESLLHFRRHELILNILHAFIYLTTGRVNMSSVFNKYQYLLNRLRSSLFHTCC